VDQADPISNHDQPILHPQESPENYASNGGSIVGWDGEQHHGHPTRALVEARHTWTEGETSQRVLHYEGRLHRGERVAYLAIERIEMGERRVFAGVVLIHRTRDWLNLKCMTEMMGPAQHGASSRLLAMLTPTTSRDAQAWRDACNASGGRS